MRRSEPPGLESLSPSHVEWVNAVCNEFEEEWERDARPAIHDYLKRACDDTEPVARLVLLRELLAIELELRAEDARAHDLDAYRALFTNPVDTDVLEFVLGGAAKQESARRFRIVKPYAKGGLGEIFVAHDEQLDRAVALKRIRPEFVEHESSRARFIGEAEITGRLEHPNIAPVYALGRDRDKRPFYAMRFIDGKPFDQVIEDFHRTYAAGGDPGKRQLALRKLLGNVISVCDAVAFAHSRDVLHRDVKPHNVMLGPFGETMLVDWGLAKVNSAPTSDAGFGLDQEVRQNGNGLSEAGSLIGTLTYMSPEQAEPKTALVGPASDVYSLGATLYHLLTGRPPFAGGDHEELRRNVIQGKFPPPREVDRTVPGALGAIVLKAMAHEPRDRYPSATALAEDIEHWLADEPVTAWREPLSIRARRGMRRHRTLAVGTAAALLVGVVGLAGFAIVLADKNRELEGQRSQVVDQRNRAQTEATIAKAVNDFVRNDLLGQASVGKQASHGAQPDPELKVRTALDRAADKIGERFAGQPVVEASVRQTIGESYFELGLASQARPHLQRAVELRRGTPGADDPETYSAMLSLGSLLKDTGKLEEAQGYLVPALDGLRKTKGLDNIETLAALIELGGLYVETNRQESAAILSEAVEWFRYTKRISDPETLSAMESLSLLLTQQKRPAQAQGLVEGVVRRLEKEAGDENQGTLIATRALAFAHAANGKPAEAERLLRKALQGQRQVLGDKHPDTLGTMVLFGEFLMFQNQITEAEALFHEALTSGREALDRNHVAIDVALGYLTDLHLRRRELKIAEGYLIEAEEITRSRHGRDHVLTAAAAANAGLLLFIETEYARAEPYLHDCWRYWAKNQPDQEGRWWSELRLGLCLLAQKKFAEAQPRLLAYYNAMKPPGDGVSITSTRDLGRLIERIKQLRDKNGQPRNDISLSKLRSEPGLQAIVFDLQFPDHPFGPP